jgi:DNA-binding transcriptional regulator YiaG
MAQRARGVQIARIEDDQRGPGSEGTTTLLPERNRARARARTARFNRKARTGLYWPVRVVAIRKRMGLSQRGLAKLIGVSVDTLQNWEQGRRQPSGPAAILLNVIEADAESVMRALK